MVGKIFRARNGAIKLTILASLFICTLANGQQSTGISPTMAPEPSALKAYDKMCQENKGSFHLGAPWIFIRMGIGGGVAIGWASDKNALYDICQFAENNRKYWYKEQKKDALERLNTITEEKWDQDDKQNDKLYNIQNSIYDTESGQYRKGSLHAGVQKNELSFWAKKNRGELSPEYSPALNTSEDRKEEEVEIAHFAAIARKRAILKEAINCPTAAKNVNYLTIYDRHLKPTQSKIETYTADVDFILSKLSDLSTRFARDSGELEEFNSEVKALRTKGLQYTVEDKIMVDETFKPQADSSGEVTQKKLVANRKYQAFSSKVVEDYFAKFQEKWTPRWDAYIGTFRTFDPITFKGLSCECNPVRLMAGVERDDVNFEKLRDERMKKCYQNMEMNREKALGLMSSNLNLLKLALLNLGTSQAQYWTLESQYLGTYRIVKNESFNPNQQEDKVCAEKLSPAEMDFILDQQKAVDAEYRELTAKQLRKKRILEEQQKQAEAQEAKEMEKKRYFMNRQEMYQSDAMKSGFVPNVVKGTGL